MRVFSIRLFSFLFAGLFILGVLGSTIAQETETNEPSTDGQTEEDDQQPENLVNDDVNPSSTTQSTTTQNAKPVEIVTERKIPKYVPEEKSEEELPSLDVKDDRGKPCILIKMEGTFAVERKTGNHAIKNQYLDKEPQISGNCEDDSSTMIMVGGDYTLTWFFSKTSGGEKWYVDRIKMEFDAVKIPDFKVEGIYEVSTPKDKSAMLFPTPVGLSYVCTDQNKTTVILDGTEAKAELVMMYLKVQPFLSKEDFGPEYNCPSHFFRDETAPIAVGSTMAIMVLLTVTGYGIYRYVKVKKVQYDTME